MGGVDFYSEGIVVLCACAPAEMTVEDVVAAANRERHPGLKGGWTLSDDPTFATGQPNPCACDRDPERRHWLLNC